jgi:outer membrane lipoprotein-sorting protein
MPKNRIIPTLGLALTIPLWAVAQDPAAGPPSASAVAPGMVAPEVAAPPTPAEKIIDAAIDKLKLIKSASADITVTADMLNQKIRLNGEYKKAEGNRVFLLLTLLGTGDESDRMLQVCDGSVLWDFTKVLNSQSCTRKSIEPILKVLNGPDCDPKLREEIITSLGFAGPESLLAGLRNAFVFDQARDGELDGRPVTILGGTWKEGKTPVFPGGGGPMSGPLPPYVPGLVTLSLGKADGWPYQVSFEGRMPAQIEQQKKKIEQPQLDAAGRPVGNKLSAPSAKPSKITLAYSKVEINAIIPDETFAFAPPEGAKPRDDTDLLVSQLEQVIAAQAERKKQQAEKSGPVLEGTLPAPGPGEADPTKPPGAPK